MATVVPAGARQLSVTGTVTDDGGTPLAGVRITQPGTVNVATTSADGSYAITYSSEDAVLVFSLFGYATVEHRPAGAARLDVVLQRGIPVAGIEVVGTRRLGRSAVETPNAIDVLEPAALMQRAGRQDLNQILHYAAPSFNANRQSGADGSDHIDPASLRGLGPDQTLVLINGKRRHTSSLINIFGTRGRGNTGTDLNAIPAAAIERIEILRDGASAQYGSDAIAGVINIVLKSSTDGFDGSVSVGAHNARPPATFDVLRADRFDGEDYRLSANYGMPLGATGFLNATAEWHRQGRTTRPADPDRFDVFRRQFGDAASESYSFFANAMMPVGENAALYAFGGYQLRHGDAYAWTREADSERNVPAIYPNGFDPRILSDVDDHALTVGVRTEHRGWDVDLYGTYGSNEFHYFVDGSLNASLLEASPTRFDAGGFRFSQRTTGARLSRFLADVASGLNIAFGVEHRTDRYGIFAGEEASYRNYGVVEVVQNGRVVQTDVLGRPGGSQGFPGFRPDNEVDE
ncbi:MAG TPA: TonB-dependent receptor plug domain-containing protein, partial [Longimicrobiales bacterium]|nr:TonB-dependent receptor plug domain-containing protein [Longimicrobiales bacterium]